MENKASPRYFILFLGLISLGILAIVQVNSSSRSTYIFIWGREQITEIHPEAGYAYIAPNNFPKFSSHINPSLAMILEEGNKLGPPDALHAAIRDSGEGASSIWHDAIYFSSSDNSDPRTNGRVYEIKYPVFYINKDKLLQGLGFTNLIFIFVLLIIWRRYSNYPFRYFKKSQILWMVILATLGFSQVYLALPKPLKDEIYTWWWIQTLDPLKYELNGTDICSPLRSEILENGTYEYSEIENASAKLQGVDRQKALLAIFQKVTLNAATNTERHLSILGFIQKASAHLTDAPTIGGSGICIADPLLVLELGDMWCGQAAYLAIDLFASAGYEGRMVQLGTHQIAEIFYDGDWHYLDADEFGNGQSVFDKDGSIPSVVELSQGDFYQMLDALPGIYHENLILHSCTKPPNSFQAYASYKYFSEDAYNSSNEVPSYYYKNASTEELVTDNLYYGWRSSQAIIETEIVLVDRPQQATPNVPKLISVSVDEFESSFTISFVSNDIDGDLLGYRIYISAHRRGWNYNHFQGSEEAKIFWSNQNGWEPSMYESLFSLPPADIDLITIPSEQNEVTVPIEHGETYYITIMPFDAYGQEIGREIYPASNELKIFMP